MSQAWDLLEFLPNGVGQNTYYTEIFELRWPAISSHFAKPLTFAGPNQDWADMMFKTGWIYKPTYTLGKVGLQGPNQSLITCITTTNTFWIFLAIFFGSSSAS